MPIAFPDLTERQLQIGLFVGGVAGGLLLGWIVRGKRIKQLPASSVQRSTGDRHSVPGPPLIRQGNSMAPKGGNRKSSAHGDLDWTSTSEAEGGETLTAGTSRARSKSKTILRDCKMVFLVRMDLDMGKGKMAAQCAHAAVGGYEEAVSRRDKHLRAWQKYGQAKIALKVPDEATLIALAEQARNNGLNTYVVRDAGRTQIVAGSLTVACIGPAPVEAIDKITDNCLQFCVARDMEEEPPEAGKVLSVNSLPSLSRQFGSMFRKALFFPSLAYNAVAERFTSRTWYNRIDEHVILGALPFRSVMQTLVETEKVMGVISFNEDYEVNPRWYPSAEEMQALGVGFLRLPVEDYTSTPTSEQVSMGLHFIEEIKERAGTTYLHCKAGRFRSAYFAAAYVIATQKFPAIAAVEFIRAKRPQIWLGPRQIRNLQQFHNALFPTEPEEVMEEPHAPNVPETPIP